MTGRKKSVSRKKSGGRRKEDTEYRRIPQLARQGEPLDEYGRPVLPPREGEPMMPVSRITPSMIQARIDRDQRSYRAIPDGRWQREEWTRKLLTQSQPIREMVADFMDARGVPREDKYLDIACARADRFLSGVSARNMEFMASQTLTASEVKKYGPILIPQSNDLRASSFRVLADAFPSGKFYLGYDNLFIVDHGNIKSPAGLYRIQSEAGADTAEMKEQGVYYFWWD